MILATVGAAFFGIVVGWIVYRTLRRKEGKVALSDISTVIGAVGGAAITALFNSGQVFGAYSIGLAVGFFTYFVVAYKIDPKNTIAITKWMGD